MHILQCSMLMNPGYGQNSISISRNGQFSSTAICAKWRNQFCSATPKLSSAISRYGSLSKVRSKWKMRKLGARRPAIFSLSTAAVSRIPNMVQAVKRISSSLSNGRISNPDKPGRWLVEISMVRRVLRLMASIGCSVARLQGYEFFPLQSWSALSKQKCSNDGVHLISFLRTGGVRKKFCSRKVVNEAVPGSSYSRLDILGCRKYET